VNENYDEYFLFSKVDLIPAQPMICVVFTSFYFAAT
jgi:hypothetical protein